MNAAKSVRRVGARAIVASLAFVHVAIAARAQDRTTIEAWGGFSGAIAGPSGTIVSAYTPPLIFGSDSTGSAGQTLAIDAGRGPGWQVGVNLFPSRHVGVQLIVDRASMDVSGANGPYAVTLTYTSRQPPDYVPRVFTTSASTPWPQTTGSLQQLAVAFNLVARTDPRRRVIASVSGGGSYYRLTGTVQPLGYTEFHLGGHSTLFSEDFRLAVSPEGHVFGFNAGADVSVAIARHAAVVAGIRFLGGPAADVPVRIAAIANADQIVFSQTIENISKQMALPGARLSVAAARTLVGLKLLY